ncbi:hypothetical protein GUITHDRAFT_114944 [Guillardia theta CCMP2712]|uniref:Uncharacterized protein n=1 Tax=Guillardia theta (strain CCMP2712) TaxID=905079 RepID=L1IT42_GUITC|nr:hypothetical protein GUITHDRAFT_114944 [Guillardia theta CCMP2712]EKX39069.1 hypothetical protein GUITHDRAFT_114944 [Guillardia theta CCMP2712]|eukprot:XP_005826049.1 hypothetical protein GUITHDRAFT_114944 [Guillardia theta CCMP2712]
MTSYRDRPRTGFMGFCNGWAGEDDFEHVPQAIHMCSQLQICTRQDFYVNGYKLESRKINWISNNGNSTPPTASSTTGYPAGWTPCDLEVLKANCDLNPSYTVNLQSLCNYYRFDYARRSVDTIATLVNDVLFTYFKRGCSTWEDYQRRATCALNHAQHGGRYGNGRNADYRPKTMQDFLLSADALFPESSSQISLSAADLGVAIYDNLSKVWDEQTVSSVRYAGTVDVPNLSVLQKEAIWADPGSRPTGTSRRCNTTNCIGSNGEVTVCLGGTCNVRMADVLVHAISVILSNKTEVFCASDYAAGTSWNCLPYSNGETLKQCLSHHERPSAYVVSHGESILTRLTAEQVLSPFTAHWADCERPERGPATTSPAS